MDMKKFRTLAVAAVCISFFIVSCNISNSGNTNPQQGAFLIANVSPDAPGLFVYINNSPFTNGFNYGVYTQYLLATQGSYDFTFFDSSSSTTPILSKTVTIDAYTNYSLFLVDSFSHLKSSFVSDVYPKPSGDSIYLRFFNFSPNAGALNLYDAASDSTLYSTRNFNDQDGNASLSSFNRLYNGASKTYNFQLKQPDGTIVASKDITLSGGRVYTLFAKGTLTGTGTQELSIGQIQNY